MPLIITVEVTPREKVGQIPDSELQSTHIQQPTGALPWIAGLLLER